MTYENRAELCQHPVAKQLFSIMAAKKTNLAFSADLTSCQKVLEVGPGLRYIFDICFETLESCEYIA